LAFLDSSFDYRVDSRFLPLLLVSGFRPQRDRVQVADGRFRATFGFLRIVTDLANVTGAHVTRDYRWWTSIGPRLSFVDDGLTFGTNRDAGVCVHFDQPVRTPLRPKGHSALTVTVADLEGLVGALTNT
jgi:hypothetical protein